MLLEQVGVSTRPRLDGYCFVFRVSSQCGPTKREATIFGAHWMLQARLWQRGLSLYYAERFADGTEQFRKDRARRLLRMKPLFLKEP